VDAVAKARRRPYLSAMNERYTFHRAERVKIGEFFWALVTLFIAIWLTGTAIYCLIDPKQRGTNSDFLVLWIVAITSWMMPVLFMWFDIGRYRQFQKKLPVLAFSEDGINYWSWTGRRRLFDWSIIENIDFYYVNGSSFVSITIGKTSVGIPLNDLNETPERILEIANTFTRFGKSV
jgi:hypothetical protein